jgi:hypothetical protein
MQWNLSRASSSDKDTGQRCTGTRRATKEKAVRSKNKRKTEGHERARGY